MKNITDNDLILLYYGEQEDPELARKVAGSDELTARFHQLSAELKLTDSYAAPQRGEDYGNEVWQRIAPQLDNDSRQKTGGLKTFWSGGIRSWWSGLNRPGVSVAGVLSLALVAALAFMLGRHGGFEPQVDSIAVSDSPASHVISNSGPIIANVDSNQLLTYSVSSHLQQVNLMLTQFANSPVSLAHESTYATDVLVANRLYRQAALNQGNKQLAALLTELEPLLIEMAYEAQKNSAATRERMQEEVNNGLLFKVRVMNNRLRKSQSSV